MRIAIWHNLPSGGGKRALYHHVKGLAARGHQVEIWRPDTRDQDYLPLGDLAPEHVLPFRWPTGKPRSPILRSLPNYLVIRGRLKAMQEHCKHCAEEIRRGGFDLLFANSCMFFAAPMIGRCVDLPKVLYLQEPCRSLYEARPRLRWAAPPRTGLMAWTPSNLARRALDTIRTRGYRIQVREELLNAQAFDRILVNSLFSRESALRAYGLDSQVCYLGVDSDLFRPTGAVRERHVVGLGGIFFGKGTDRAIRALATIPKEKRPDLVWIGNFADPRYQQGMESLAASLGVRFVPKVRVSDADLLDGLSNAAAMVYTSRLEPFGLAPLEANACETPVVAIAEGGVRESIVDGLNGILVDHDDPVALGAAILRLLDNPTEARAMGQAARKLVEERWGWDHAVDRLERHLLAVAGRRTEDDRTEDAR